MIIRFGALPNSDAVSPVSDVRQLICSVHRTVSLCSFTLDSPCDRRQWSTQLKFLHGYETFSISSVASLQTTRNSAIADKPARRVYRSVNVTKHSTIPYVRYNFLLCNSNFVFKTRRYYDIRLQKCCDIEIQVRGYSRSLKMVPSDRLCMVSY